MTWSTISRFDGEYAFLSNFYESPIVMPDWHPSAGLIAPTVEHAFQAAKTDLGPEAYRVIRAGTPQQAKRLGRGVILRPGWDSGRKVIMTALLRVKFAPNTELANMLLATGNNMLIEGNHWNDTYWGVCNDVGANWLGRCLMLVRAELDVFSEYTNLPRVADLAHI